MENPKEIGERVKQLREEHRWTQGELSRRTGPQGSPGHVPQPTISRIENGTHKETQEDTLRNLAPILGVSVRFLRYGKTDTRSGGVQPDKKRLKRWVPVISWVQAGEWKEAIDLHHPGGADDWIPLLLKRKVSDNVYALVVEGESMIHPVDPLRGFPPGIHIIVDPEDRTPTSGQFVVARLKGTDTVTFKQFKVEDGKPYLKPLNPDFKPIHDEFLILGRVVGRHDVQDV